MRYIRLYSLAVLALFAVLITRASSISNGSGGGSGTVTSVTVAGTANQVAAIGTCTSTTNVNCTMSLPASVVMPGALSFAGTGPYTMPLQAGGATTANGTLLYNTTNNTITAGFNGASRVVVSLTGSPAANDCMQFFAASTSIYSAGAPCLRPVASGTTAMPVIAVAANSCSAAATTAVATGALTTDSARTTFASDPTGVLGYGGGTNGGITINPWITANQINFKLCNQTGSSITPGAISINWGIAR